jgi:hypothetical protein
MTASTTAIAGADAASDDHTRAGEGGQVNGGGETIPFDVLPPAISRDNNESVEAADEEPRRPRRRSRGPRPAEGDDEIAPAA